MIQKTIILGGKIIDVVERRVFKGEISISYGIISNIEKKENVPDVYILPGLIDSHIHIESSMLLPSEFAKIAVKHGTVATVSDTHEIANILGIEGIDFMIDDGNKVPFKFFFGAPSCVPSTEFETSGASISSREVGELLRRKDIYFLSEMMNYPGVIYNDTEVYKKIDLSKKLNKKIDGHAPGLKGVELKKYVKPGISTEHECINEEEALEKIKYGMNIQIREGSAAKNFNALYKIIDKYPDKVMFCTDDSHPDDLIKGHIDIFIRRGKALGINIFNLLRAASYNPVKHYGLNVGLLQPNDPADMIVIKDLDAFKVEKTYIDGQLVYENGNVYFPDLKKKEINNFNRNAILEKDLQVPAKTSKIHVIEVINGELFTRKCILNAKIENNFLYSDIDHDILKIVVVNRYKNAPPAIGFIKGFGLKKGALASSIAHDSHNIIAVGTNDQDLTSAINKIIEQKGGIVAACKNEIVELRLEIGGIMSTKNGFEIANKYELLQKMAKEYGSPLKAPFMTLSFMALLVIPELKIGDKGLFDVNKFEFISLFK